MEEIRPTAKWANRMLRPLTSIHHRLEKHHEIRKSIADARSKEKDSASETDENARVPTATADAADCTTFSDEEPDDPAWIPGKPNRRIRHNYSSRGQRNGARRRSRLLIKSPEVQRTLPGAIEIATPLITGRTLGGASEASTSASIRKQLFRNVTLPSAAGEAAGTGQGENRRASRTNNANFPAYQGSWKEALDFSGDAGVVDVARFLDRMFMKFLNNTRAGAQREEGGRGARSLLAMAARRLPEFIADEQRLQDEAEEDGEVDMCDAYFTELEAHYAPGGRGWQPLRDAVRAQGIHLISEMMLKGWVPRLATCRLLEECLNQGELDAFETLLSRYLTTIRTYDYPPAFDPPGPRARGDDPIHILRVYYTRAPGRRYFVFDEVAKLLSRRAFPPEWMVTARWKKCVDGAIRSLSTGDGDSAAATRAIEAIVLSSAGVFPVTDSPVVRAKGKGKGRGRGRGRGKNAMPAKDTRAKDTRASVANSSTLPQDLSPCPIPIQDALTNLSSSLVTALCGMSIARSQAPDADERSTGRKVRFVVGSLSFTVQRAIGLVLSLREMEGLSFHGLRRGYVLLGEWLLQCHETSTPEVISQSNLISPKNVESFCLSLANQQEWVKQLAEFVQQVFHCCGHARKGDPTRTPREVRTIVSRLAQLTTRTGRMPLLGKVAAETAMALAEITLDEDDHAWALETQGQAISSQQERPADEYEYESESESLASTHQPSSQTALDLYRWEDSIGEWVASTPAPKAPQPPKTSTSTDRVSTESCSTSSRSPSPAPSETVASSVTSSAPSVSGKRGRGCAQADWTPPLPSPSPKRLRLRSSARTNAAAVAVMSPSDESTRSGSPVAARTRTALRDLPQAKNRVVQVQQHRATAMASRKVAPQIEVVIINRSPSASGLSPSTMDLPAPLTVCRPRNARGRGRPPANRLNLKPPPLPTSLPDPKLDLPRVTRTRTPAVQVRREIPCSQDDSEDELSFL
ncbi:hypothetical protein BO70DRAFT_357598 [Aspergillus heteromorphus CBS 117.55]|uniref:Uncharacterized protein n=1 Tax=Aspergillus heteromorphus CBS 117.55 TaxID=1448321 RepID=A0A317X6E3_9EURO|nr:uncharacterized protein BO70DRAFT_357598 [Aspergillus heteromorphus CBS 117.55]PWY92468.1 hypothetical protein BO70DRAFT_357598 [Aspergillus heteromorphus CBS 117.55]